MPLTQAKLIFPSEPPEEASVHWYHHCPRIMDSIGSTAALSLSTTSKRVACTIYSGETNVILFLLIQRQLVSYTERTLRALLDHELVLMIARTLQESCCPSTTSRGPGALCIPTVGTNSPRNGKALTVKLPCPGRAVLLSEIQITLKEDVRYAVSNQTLLRYPPWQ